MKANPEKVIEDWLNAFERANGKPPMHLVSYENGWFVFRSRALVISRYRKADMLAMTKLLSLRANTSGERHE